MAKNRYLYRSMLCANILTFAVGMTLSWSSSVMPKLADKLDPSESSLITSLSNLGAVLGPFVAAYDSERYGRKACLIGAGIPLLVGYIILATPLDAVPFMIARFSCGLTIGALFTVLPQYIAEMSEDRTRGTLGSIMNIFLCAGILASYAIGPYVSIMLFNLIILAIVCVFLVSFALVASETPQWLITKKREMQAKDVLIKLRNTPFVDQEFRAITNAVHENSGGSFRDLTKRGNAKALGISIALAFFQQFSGINVVLYYAQTIFMSAGSDRIAPEICSIIVGAVEFGSSFISPLLVDQWGRKVLLLLSALVMMLAQVPLGLYFYLQDDGVDVDYIFWLPVVSLVIYLIAYNSGFGPLPWTIMAELFPPNIKNLASSLTASICWFLAFLLTNYFNVISDGITMGGMFWLFSACNVVGFIFVFFFLPETKGKSQREIQEILNRTK